MIPLGIVQIEISCQKMEKDAFSESSSIFNRISKGCVSDALKCCAPKQIQNNIAHISQEKEESYEFCFLCVTKHIFRQNCEN